MNAADLLSGLGSRKEFNEALPHLPPGWRVAPNYDRFEFRFNSVRDGYQYVIRWRRTKPEGWVCFEVKLATANVPGLRTPLPVRRKFLPQSFPTPVAAAMAIHLAGGV